MLVFGVHPRVSVLKILSNPEDQDCFQIVDIWYVKMLLLALKGAELGVNSNFLNQTLLKYKSFTRSWYSPVNDTI